MGRPLRADQPGYVYHVLNRANGRLRLFHKDADFEAFLAVLRQAQEREPTRLLAYCVMPNHWHLVVWPRKPGELSRFAGWLALTHTQRWHAHRHSSGIGHLYQGRFKSFPVAEDEHFLTVCRYVERNALRAGLVEDGCDWRWGSLWLRERGGEQERSLLTDWPVPRPPDWARHVNAAQTEAELEALRRCVQRGQPFGDEAWRERTAKMLGLASTLRPRGRPRKKAGKGS